MILVQTKTMNVALIPNPIIVVIKFIPGPVISKSLKSENPNWKNLRKLENQKGNRGEMESKRRKGRGIVIWMEVSERELGKTVKKDGRGRRQLVVLVIGIVVVVGPWRGTGSGRFSYRTVEEGWCQKWRQKVWKGGKERSIFDEILLLKELTCDGRAQTHKQNLKLSLSRFLCGFCFSSDCFLSFGYFWIRPLRQIWFLSTLFFPLLLCSIYFSLFCFVYSVV